MTKQEAIALFGGRPIDLARAVRLSRQAINVWPEHLRAHHIDKVHAALYRQQQALAVAGAPVSPTGRSDAVPPPRVDGSSPPAQAAAPCARRAGRRRGLSSTPSV